MPSGGGSPPPPQPVYIPAPQPVAPPAIVAPPPAAAPAAAPAQPSQTPADVNRALGAGPGSTLLTGGMMGTLMQNAAQMILKQQLGA